MKAPPKRGSVRMDVMNADAREWCCRYFCQACGLNPQCPASPLSWSSFKSLVQPLANNTEAADSILAFW